MIEDNLAYAFQAVQKLAPETGPPPGTLLLDSIARGVIFVNDDGIVTFINRYAAEVLHVWQESVTGKRVDMLPLSTPLYKLLSEQCRGVHLEMPVRGRIIAARTTTLRSGSGVACGEMTELWDVTEEKRSKRQWEEFVTMTTHDLKSPLNAIMGYIQGMQCGMFGEIGGQLRTVAEKAEESGKTLHAMIEEMLDNFRLEVGLLKLSRQRCDLGQVLAGCCRDNLRSAQEQGLSFSQVGLEGIPELYVDCRQLTRVFNNLIGNAIKYTPSGGEVTIRAEIDGDGVHVAITDTGIGIPPEDLARIFYKYYRSAGAAAFKGTGLGLAISKYIVEAHGGGIDVASCIGAGSTFTVSIPLGSREDDESAPR